MDNRSIERYRREFPVSGKYIYLDHAGLAPLSLRVKAAVETFIKESVEGGAFYYPRWARQVTDIRRACARLINAEPGEIAFVKSTSHGLSLIAEGLTWKQGDNLLIYEKDFPSNIYPWINLRRKGIEVRTIPFREGKIPFEGIEQLIDSRTQLLAISSVQYANGYRLDLKRLGRLCRDRGILLCIDAIQSLGVIPMDVKENCIDFLAADAHKWLLGPAGIGIFFCRKDLVERINPPLVGWKSMQNEFDFDNPAFNLKPDALRFEEGSMNHLGILGLGAAIEILFEVGIDNIEERVLGLGDLIIQESEKRGYTVLTPKRREERGGNITFSGKFDPAKMSEALREKNIMVNVRGGGLRLSPHFYNIEEEIQKVFETLDLLCCVRGWRCKM
ncbi:MAG TPA: aminotransferase class V-fold PLP-dependent enzyme [Nitrospirota bacterium]|nr:aminotransferase class V-fold PLP-dependent enzyme [Nitrospirota bacterium]